MWLVGDVKEIEQCEDEITYEIEWDKRTLDGMHPAWKSCERDGLERSHVARAEYIEPMTAPRSRRADRDQDAAAVGRDQDDRLRMASD
jgi:hypothetical protein